MPVAVHRLHAVRAGLHRRLHQDRRAGDAMSGPAPTVRPAALAAALGATADAARDAINVLIVGVGGQGVIMVSKVLALLAQTPGLRGQAERSARHGQARRRGVQPCALRPAGLVADHPEGRRRYPGRAGMGGRPALAALSQAGHRHLHLRHQAHRAAVRLPQPPARRAAALFARDAGRSHRACRRRAMRSTPPDMAEELGNERAANVVLLGALSTALQFPGDGLGDARLPSSCRRRPSRSTWRRSAAAAAGSRRRAPPRRAVEAPAARIPAPASRAVPDAPRNQPRPGARAATSA